MNKFRCFIDDNELKELYMHGRRFTWSNERGAPTLTKIYRVLVSVDWDLEYTDCLPQEEVGDFRPISLLIARPTSSQSYWQLEFTGA